MKLSPVTLAAAKRVQDLTSKIEVVRNAAETEGRDLNDTESTQLAGYVSDLDKAMGDHAESKKTDERIAAAQSISDSIGGTGMEIASGGVVKVGAQVDPFPEGKGWITAKVAAETEGNTDAIARLAAFEKVAATVSGDLGTALVPKGLIDRIVRLAIGGRDVLAAIPKGQLPPLGTTVHYPREKVAPVVDLINPEGEDVATGDIEYEAVEIPICEYAGLVEITMRALRRGNISESQIERSIAAQIGKKLNTAVVKGAGSGDHTGLLTAAGLSADAVDIADVLAFRRRVVSGKTKVLAARDRHATHLIVTPNMFGVMESAVDTLGRPLFNALDVVGPTNSLGTLGYSRGTFAGLSVLVDANLSGMSVDSALVVLMDEVVLLGGDDIRSFRAEKVSNLSVEIAAANESALGIDHTGAICKIVNVPKFDLEADPEPEE